jgi:hypothetical protein
MSINFPNNPTVNQKYSNGDRSWIWTGVYWKSNNIIPGYRGSAGEIPLTFDNLPPLNPRIGERWFNNEDGVELIWTDDGIKQQWVEIAALGIIGPQGYTGSAASIDDIGYTGSASTNLGYTGSIGINSGYTGSVGYQGSSGMVGYRGFTGPDGGFSFYGYTGSLGKSIIEWQTVQNQNFNAVAGKGYPINTYNDPVYVLFPGNPSLGDIINIIDYSGTWGTNPVVVLNNGKNIYNANAPAIFKTNRLSVSLVFIDNTQGWVPVSGHQISNVIPYNLNYNVNYLIVAGGGGGGHDAAGGGGGGGFVSGTIQVSSGFVYNVVIGGGGTPPGGYSTPAGNGSDSSVFGVTAIGGGRGGTKGNTGASGGSGGGTGHTNGSSGGSGTTGQGNAGGAGGGSGGGGGGGAGAVGTVGGGNGGTGGDGLTSSITGTPTYYAGGGGGGSYTNSGGPGGAGGGGPGGSSGGAVSGTLGTANTGGGGGGGGYGTGTGAQGGSGIIIISIPTIYYTEKITGSTTVITSGSNKIITFTTSGSYTG